MRIFHKKNTFLNQTRQLNEDNLELSSYKKALEVFSFSQDVEKSQHVRVHFMKKYCKKRECTQRKDTKLGSVAMLTIYHSELAINKHIFASCFYYGDRILQGNSVI